MGEDGGMFLIALAGLGTVVGFLTGLFVGRRVHLRRQLRRPTADAELTVDLAIRCACGRTVTVPAGFQISTGFRERLGALALDSVTVVDSVIGQPLGRA